MPFFTEHQNVIKRDSGSPLSCVTTLALMGHKANIDTVAFITPQSIKAILHVHIKWDLDRV